MPISKGGHAESFFRAVGTHTTLVMRWTDPADTKYACINQNNVAHNHGSRVHMIQY